MKVFLKKNFVIILTFSVSLLLVIYLLMQWSLNTETYSWNQRVTMSVETDRGFFESSTIHQVEWKRNWCPFPSGLECDRWSVTLTGDAPLVELPNDTVVLATLGGGDRRGFARMLVSQFENSPNYNLTPHEEAVRRTAESAAVNAKVASPSASFPVIIGFVDKSDSESVFYVSPTTPENQALGIQSVTVLVEKTEDRLGGSKITQTFPWLVEMDEYDRIDVSYGTYNGRSNTGRIAVSAFSSELALENY